MLARPRIITAIMLMSFAAAAPAEAHALLLSSDPAAGSSVQASSLDFTLHYNSRVDAGRSRLILRKDGAADETLAVKGGDGPAVLTSHTDGLAPGKFVLHWEVLSVDGHISRGDLPFVVGAP